MSDQASQEVLTVKNPPANAEDMTDTSSIPGSGRSPGEGHGNPLQYFCLENSMDRGTWQASVYGVSQSWTQLKQLSTYAWSIPTTEKEEAYLSFLPSKCNAGFECLIKVLIFHRSNYVFTSNL